MRFMRLGGSIGGVCRAGRRRFRFLCPQGCGGSSPPFRTNNLRPIPLAAKSVRFTLGSPLGAENFPQMGRRRATGRNAG